MMTRRRQPVSSIFIHCITIPLSSPWNSAELAPNPGNRVTSQLPTLKCRPTERKQHFAIPSATQPHPTTLSPRLPYENAVYRVKACGNRLRGTCWNDPSAHHPVKFAPRAYEPERGCNAAKTGSAAGVWAVRRGIGFLQARVFTLASFSLM